MKVGNGRAFGVARYRFTKHKERIDNITDWAFNKFVARYGKKPVALAPRPLAGGGLRLARMCSLPITRSR